MPILGDEGATQNLATISEMETLLRRTFSDSTQKPGISDLSAVLP